jgi:hypothetical protein
VAGADRGMWSLWVVGSSVDFPIEDFGRVIHDETLALARQVSAS